MHCLRLSDMYPLQQIVLPVCARYLIQCHPDHSNCVLM